MTYPFETFRATQKQTDFIQKKIPHVASVMPEFFRVMVVAYTSIDQKNLYGMPHGIRQDLGVETSLKLLLIACCNDRLIAANESAKSVLEKLRVLTLLWYAKGANLNACLFFGYYFYTQHSNALYLVKSILQQNEFLVDVSQNLSDNSESESLFKAMRSSAWYKSVGGLGDKLSTAYVQEGDYTRTDLPKPGYLVHFKKTGMYDLRVPMFLDPAEVEVPVIQQSKVIVSCPKCHQKCRGPLFEHIEVSCPTCQQKWSQRT
ncbi:MAG: hypothetical protein RLZ00_234 [Pseudomonadota bacterium]|jgi:hypothetical protein